MKFNQALMAAAVAGLVGGSLTATQAEADGKKKKDAAAAAAPADGKFECKLDNTCKTHGACDGEDGCGKEPAANTCANQVAKVKDAAACEAMKAKLKPKT